LTAKRTTKRSRVHSADSDADPDRLSEPEEGKYSCLTYVFTVFVAGSKFQHCLLLSKSCHTDNQLLLN